MADLHAISSFEDEIDQPPGTFKLIQGTIVYTITDGSLKIGRFQIMRAMSTANESLSWTQFLLRIPMSHW